MALTTQDVIDAFNEAGLTKSELVLLAKQGNLLTKRGALEIAAARKKAEIDALTQAGEVYKQDIKTQIAAIEQQLAATLAS